MLEQNVEKILSMIKPSDKVLDIGGWAQPFNRANYVVDIMPYETRGFFGCLGPKRESFSKETWIFHDLSSRKPLPFENKEIDFVICSHTLEDIRDPIYLCSEIIRTGKRGYIEVPSRTMESINGLEHRKYVGYYHHRWIVEFEKAELTFRFKTMLLNKSWKYRFPKSYLKKLRPEDRVSWLFWEDSFQFKEVIQISELLVAQELAEFVEKWDVYPQWLYRLDKITQSFKSGIITLTKNIIKRSAKLRNFAEKRIGRSVHLEDTKSFWSDIPPIHSK